MKVKLGITAQIQMQITVAVVVILYIRMFYGLGACHLHILNSHLPFTHLRRKEARKSMSLNIDCNHLIREIFRLKLNTPAII